MKHSRTDDKSIRVLMMVSPFFGAFIAWKISGSNEIGVFMLVGALLTSIYYYFKFKNN